MTFTNDHGIRINTNLGLSPDVRDGTDDLSHPYFCLLPIPNGSELCHHLTLASLINRKDQWDLDGFCLGTARPCPIL